MILKRYTDLYVCHGEPWSEAKAYLARIIDKVGSIMPRSVSEACTRALESIRTHLSYAPTDFAKHKVFIQSWVDEVRDHLDSNARDWSWDSHMNDIYLDVRSDLTVLDTLVGVGEISVKTLLQERSMLISQL